ncbi:hypothetical protein DICVIV_13859 [Dictyocaulus viviparus]|uniref:Uncharacterized protein n=1 Tax=Dictyocaulus viviparus TaxID=29172 RepID=A0A0D8XCQ0_DICVI|nr:hypothetical protein DICVIV_13859 [Dictyocaulus viviparus]
MIHIKKCAYGVAAFYASVILSNLLLRLYKSDEVQWNWQLLFLVSDILAVVCLVYGLARERAAFLQPFTIISIITVSFCVLLTAFYLMAAFNPQSFAREQIEILIAGQIKSISKHFSVTSNTVLLCAALIGTLIYGSTVIVHSWFMIIVVRCAQHFRMKQPSEVNLNLRVT